VTDGQTEGIAIASTALAMRALRSAVKTTIHLFHVLICRKVGGDFEHPNFTKFNAFKMRWKFFETYIQYFL